MPEEMLSFPAVGSTPRLTKPVAYGTIGAPKSEVRKIVGASNTSHIRVTGAKIVYLAFGCYTQTLYLKVRGLVAESREVYRMKNHRLKNPRCTGICPWVLW